ncbi:ABC-2 family transporter protein [Reichenbachiella faecimaris]|uniref:ABC-2 family transporter protein n=1 Tax=Reichenbachiella faecimaris TaxID=692418 RepID=A0A1W2G6W8_REIFA|nr:ABC transporter permease subunit [Reichenbachiella faecimaris]SMD32419.1 ABC-2 family transporter protein [Reichenbachiella faecimaris]
MTRLLQIEWLKLKYNRPFWILVAMYSIGVIIVCSGGMLFLNFLKNQGADFDGIDPTIIPIYDFPDVWHNISYVATFFKVLLGFIIVISIANEASYRTMRQNVIDGLSKKEFLQTKLLIIGILSISAMVLLFLIGLITGGIYSHILGWKYVFSDLQFLFAYGFEVFCYLTFALMIALLVRKSGLVIVGLLMYTLIFDPVAAKFIEHFPYIWDEIRFIKDYLPVTALNNLIHVPFMKYFFQEIQDYISWKELAIVSGWLMINIGLSYWVLKKRDI